MKKPRDKEALVDRLLQEIEELKAKNKKLRDALRRLSQWLKAYPAYPLSVFPEPDFAKVRKALKEYNIALDVVSASNMRHVIKGISDIVEQALKG